MCCLGAPSGHCPQVCAACRRPGLLGKLCGSCKAAFGNTARLLTDFGFLQRRLKCYFEMLPCFPIGCADLQTLDTMQPMERKRQGYIHELIQTEERYVDDLQLVVEVRGPADRLWEQTGGRGTWRRGVTSTCEFTSSDGSSHPLERAQLWGQLFPRLGNSKWREREETLRRLGLKW